MMKKISYPLSSDLPLYPGTPEFSNRQVKSIAKGDSANTSILSLSNHSGTHIDAPDHFCPGGKTTKDLLGERFEVRPVYCIDIQKTEEKAIRISDIKQKISECSDAGGIFLRTGMSGFRATNPEKYRSGHPWIHPEIPEFLREMYPKIQIFGTDTISISNPHHREDGRACHRAFLCDKSPILLVEDLDLSDPVLLSAPLTITFYPLVVGPLDGVPVFAFAEPMMQESGGEENVLR